MPKKIDLTGQRFGRLTVIEIAGKEKYGNIMWKCKCDCGNEVVVSRTNHLRTGNTKSCGCHQKKKVSEIQTKHGQSKKSIYGIWTSMLKRCYNPNNPHYKNYGGRGIQVYRKWWKFENFYKDMGDKPEGLTLDRIDNNKGYYPNNCKWATRQEQAQNVRCNGYCWDKKKRKWKAYIIANYKQIYLGDFNEEKNAKQAYLDAKKKYHKTNNKRR